MNQYNALIKFRIVEELINCPMKLEIRRLVSSVRHLFTILVFTGIQVAAEEPRSADIDDPSDPFWTPRADSGASEPVSEIKKITTVLEENTTPHSFRLWATSEILRRFEMSEAAFHEEVDKSSIQDVYRSLNAVTNIPSFLYDKLQPTTPIVGLIQFDPFYAHKRHVLLMWGDGGQGICGIQVGDSGFDGSTKGAVAKRWAPGIFIFHTLGATQSGDPVGSTEVLPKNPTSGLTSTERSHWNENDEETGTEEVYRRVQGQGGS